LSRGKTTVGFLQRAARLILEESEVSEKIRGQNQAAPRVNKDILGDYFIHQKRRSERIRVQIEHLNAAQGPDLRVQTDGGVQDPPSKAAA
jgi:hypothetical protein